MSEAFRRYFKRCTLAPALISAAFISIYAIVLEIRQLARRKKSRGAGRSRLARRTAVLASKHLTTTVIKCAAVMTSCFDDSSYLTRSLVVGINLSASSRKKRKKEKEKEMGLELHLEILRVHLIPITI